MIRTSLIIACLAVAGAALAEQGAPLPTGQQARDLLAVTRATPAMSYEKTHKLRMPGVAQTSVGRKLGSDGLTASAGFLCGLQPSYLSDGAAGAHGYDPNGRFLGAKLSLPF